MVGFMGAGKSTGARALAAELGGEALDSDRLLEQRLGEPIEALVDEMMAGNTYVNVHTERYPDGEIRGHVIADD